MSERTKEIILKTLLVIGSILFVLIFPGSVLISYLLSDELLGIYYYTVIGSFFAVGILFMILAPIFGGLKQKPVKAEKIPLAFNSYNELMAFLQKSLVEKEYFEQKQLPIDPSAEVILYIKSVKRHILDCFAIIRVAELSDEILETVNNIITDILTDYYGGKTITDTVNVISVFCVDRITPAFQKIVNGNIQQGFKNGRLPVGISFGGKNIYIAKQKDGFAITRYKLMRKEFADIMKI